MADKNTVKRLEEQALRIRKDLIDLCFEQRIHIGGDLSAADVMVSIWQYAMHYDPKQPKWEDRDRFVLSKGHAAAVTSLNQVLLGCYTRDEVFGEYATDNGRFGMHSCNLINPHVEVSTGSLGHGLPVAGGIAQALRLKKCNSRVFVVMGDGEQHEGSIWEAAMSAPQLKLGNLVAFIDRNGLSLDGHTEELLRLEPLAEKWRAFGWNVVELDGNDMAQLVDAIDALPAPDSDVPTLIIAKTTKGHGVSYMQDVVGWHNGTVSQEDHDRAIAELDKAFADKWGDA